MAQNVTVAGASYSDVPSVELPKTGGGTASFTDVTDTTAAAADVASGKYFYTAAGVKTQGTASGGGSASNVVTGTFKGTTTGTAMDINLPYTGGGYPVAVIVYPSDGSNNPNGTFYSLVQRYAVKDFFAVKANIATAPDYENSSTADGGRNVGCVVSEYKSSTSTATNYSRGGNNRILFYDNTNATSGSNTCVILKSSTKMSVYIASTSYGFAANIEYKYWVLYSS